MKTTLLLGSVAVVLALAAAPPLLADEAFASDYSEEIVDPVLTLVGKSEITVAEDGAFTDPGAMCTGKHVNEAGHKTVTGTPVVDTSVLGSHTLTYSCTDTRGVKAPDISRTVKVVVKPTITLIGDASVKEEWGRSYKGPGATCTGEFIPGGSKKVDFGSINAKLGANTLTYKCTDTRGISADPVTRTLTYTATPPVLKLNGGATDTIQAGHPYNDPGATCTGEFIPGGSKKVYSDTDTKNLSVGENKLTYKCKDTRGISADPVTRTITATAPPVIPPPVITLKGLASVEVELTGPNTPKVRQAAYDDPGATCKGQTIPGGSKTVYGSVGAMSLGENKLTYKCMGTRGDEADPVTRTVTLTFTPPVLKLNGDANAVHRGVQSYWQDPGATCTGPFINGGSKTVYNSGQRSIHPENIGQRTLTYTCKDTRGAGATATGTVLIYGRALAIELKGESAVTIYQGESWTDPGAKCKYGGYSRAWTVYSSDSVDTETPDTYTLTYKCKDYFDVWSSPVSRTVTVVASGVSGTPGQPGG